MKNLSFYLAIGGAIPFGIAIALTGMATLTLHACIASPTFAQITPDTTLPSNSIVTPSGNTLEITGGTRAGGNLFHSFGQFSIPTGTQAFFNNSLDIQNIISRVTGRNISTIDGLIRANGGANLFLINPNGIIFGPNAQLNIGGSFFASTAESVKLSDGNFYSATNPQAPPLLTINVPIGLQYGQNSGRIVNQSKVKDSSDRPVGLQVLPGQTLALVGGDVAIEGGILTAPGGRIELGSVAGNNLVNLNPINTSFTLGYEGVQNFQDIQLSAAANVDTSADKSGDILIQARQFTLAEGSRIVSVTESQPGGNVSVNASESVELIGDGELSEILVDLLSGNLNRSNFKNGLFTATVGAGTGGNLTLNTRSLTLQNGGLAATLTAGSGRGGNLTVNASESVQLLGNNSLLLPITVSEAVEIGFPLVLTALATVTLGEGAEAGNVTINSPRLTVRDRAVVLSGSFGAGKGGNITVNAPEFIDTKNNALVVTVALAAGDAGDIKIATEEVNLVNRGGIGTGTIGVGNAGSVSIYARHIFMEGTTIFGSTTGSGQAGNIIINASESVQLNPTAYIVSQTEGEGNAGDVMINTSRFIARGNRAGVTTATVGGGRGGDLTVNASESVELSGNFSGEFAVSKDFIESFLKAPKEFIGDIAGLTTANARGSGDAGNLTVVTPKLTIGNGAGIATAALEGRGGNLTVRASESINMAGVSGLIAATFGSQRAGDLTVETPQLTMRNGAAISTDTFGAGDAGTLTIIADKLSVLDGSRVGAATTFDNGGKGGTLIVNASQQVEVLGTSADGKIKSGLFTNTLGSGNAGDIRVETERLIVENGGNITVSGEGGGSAGNLSIKADFIKLDRGAIAAETQSGARGNITLQTGALQMRNNSNVTTNATDTATGGNIAMNLDTLAALENSDISANSVDNFGGQVDISALAIFLQGIDGTQVKREATPFTSDITATSQLGLEFDGLVIIKTPDVDPTSGIAALQNPCTGAGNSSAFVNIGRGGLPPDFTEILNLDVVNESHSNSASGQIVEATGMAIAPDGKVHLFVQAPVATNARSWQTFVGCSLSPNYPSFGR